MEKLDGGLVADQTPVLFVHKEVIKMNRKVTVTKKIIDACFDVDHQADAMVNLYKLVYPDWDSIRKIDGFPRAGKELCVYICRSFIKFDEKHHPDVIKGGLWFNNGFSSLNTDDLDWEIDANDIPVVFDRG